MKKSGPGVAPEHTDDTNTTRAREDWCHPVIEGAFVCLVQNIRMRNRGTIFSLVCSPFFKKTQPQALCQPLVAGKWHKLAYHTLAGSNWRKDDPIWITSCKRKLRAEPANTRQPEGKTAPVFSPFTVGLSHCDSLNTRTANSWITSVLLLNSTNIILLYQQDLKWTDWRRRDRRNATPDNRANGNNSTYCKIYNQNHQALQYFHQEE